MAARTADAPAQLVQLRQTQPVGILNDEGVDVRNVEAGLDDGRADQHLNLAVGHALHDVAERFLAHFSVRNADLTGVTQQRLDARGAFVDGLDAVVKVVDLPAAFQLAPDGVEQKLLAVLEHERLDGVAVLRRLLDGGHIAKPRQRHVERARDRRCRQG